MKIPRSLVVALGSILAAAVVSCEQLPVDRSPPPPDPSVAPASVELSPVDTVRLEEPDGRELGSLTELAAGPGGRFAAVDRPNGRVHVFGPAGELRRVLGSGGSLPEPMDATFVPDGRLVVATLRAPHLHVFAVDGHRVRSFDLAGVPMALKAEAAGDGRVAVYNHRSDPAAPRVGVYDLDGNLLARFHPSPPDYYETPYWAAATERLLAADGDEIVAGGNLLYPFVRHARTGGISDSVGSPPGSWTAASRPERGAFRGPDAREEFEKWRRSFTTVAALTFYRDSLLAVAHEELDPDVLSYEKASYRMDLYGDGVPVLRDRSLPGRLLQGGEYLWVLGSAPPDGWTLIGYRVTEDGAS